MDELKQLFDKKNISPQECFTLIQVEPTYGYQLLNGTRKPPREILLRAAIVLQLSLEDTQQLLRQYEREILYPRNRYDAILVYCITHACSTGETNQVLEDFGQKKLFI